MLFTLGAAAVIIARKDIVSNALSVGGTGIGYQLAGDAGAYFWGCWWCSSWE